MQYPRDARRELRNACAAQVNPNAKRRQAYSQIILAKSYLVEQEYETATQVAGKALAQVKMISSSVNLARISALCRELQGSEYGKNHVEVAALEVEVAKAQHPQLFQ